MVVIHSFENKSQLYNFLKQENFWKAILPIKNTLKKFQSKQNAMPIYFFNNLKLFLQQESRNNNIIYNPYIQFLVTHRIVIKEQIK